MKRLFAFAAILLLLAACNEGLRPHALPFPTPGQHDLVVLTHQNPLAYATGDGGNLEHDLIEAFAQELGVGVHYTTVQPGRQLSAELADGNYHLASAWLSPSDEPGMQTTPPLFLTRDLLVQNESSLPLTDTAQLAGKTVHALAGSRQAATLKSLAQTTPGLKVVEVQDVDVLDLLDHVGEQKIEFAVIDSRLEDVANQLVPTLRTTLALSTEHPIVWLLGKHPNAELAARASAFVERVQHDGTLARLEERYFGHVRRLTQASIVKFLADIRTMLPRLRAHFQAAQAMTGIDWRLIAAVAYQESHWDPNATSYTNVRGIMMLTEETADRLGVLNRLDPRASIIAGARYLSMIRDMLPSDVPEPDRTWLALAGYNLGPGHLSAARMIARQLKADPDAWFEMKRILPLLAKPQYYERLKSGRARGGEAVILVENIRSYYDIIVRNEAATLAAGQHPGSLAGDASGLKLKP